MDTSNLKLKRQTWYARVRVPEGPPSPAWQDRTTQDSGDSRPARANRRKHRVLADLQALLTQTELHGALAPEAADYIVSVAKAQLNSVRDGVQTLEMARHGLHAAMDTYVDAQSKRHGANEETGDPLDGGAHRKAMDLAVRLLEGEETAMLSDAFKTYLAEVKPRLRNQTWQEKARHLADLQKWLKGDLEVRDVTKKLAGRYVSEFLLAQGHAAKTTKDTISNLSTVWAWMDGRGLAESNPWAGMSKTVKVSTRGTKPPRRPWTDAELLRLVQEMPDGDPMLPLSLIAIYSGMRREEVAGLRASDLDGDVLVVREGKSRAAVRQVPVHPIIKPLVRHLAKASTDGYLIPGLLTGGADAKRAHYVGKWVGYFIRSLFDDTALVFHSLRNAFMQRCEEGGVPESMTKLLLGHSRKGSITYGDAIGGYSPGVKLDTLRREIAKVTFGKLDDHVKKIGPDISVTVKSARRPSTTRKFVRTMEAA